MSNGTWLKNPVFLNYGNKQKHDHGLTCLPFSLKMHFQTDKTLHFHDESE